MSSTLPGSPPLRLGRVPFKERRLEEGWLQQILFQHPAILPAEEIDTSFAPPIPLGLPERDC